MFPIYMYACEQSSLKYTTQSDSHFFHVYIHIWNGLLALYVIVLQELWLVNFLN